MASSNQTLCHKKPVTTPMPPAPPTHPVKTYANCAALNVDYPHGVGLSGAHDSTSGTPVSDFTVAPAVYNANTKSDRDHDGIACEKR